MGSVRHPDDRQRGADASLRLEGNQRRLGGCVADVVAPNAAEVRTHQTAGDLSGQRSEEFRSANAILETHGAVRGLDRTGDSAGVLSTLPQQVQSGRTLLVVPAEEMEWRTLELPESGDPMRAADDLEGTASNREAALWPVSRRRSRSP